MIKGRESFFSSIETLTFCPDHTNNSAIRNLQNSFAYYLSSSTIPLQTLKMRSYALQIIAFSLSIAIGTALPIEGAPASNSLEKRGVSNYAERWPAQLYF